MSRRARCGTRTLHSCVAEVFTISATFSPPFTTSTVLHCPAECPPGHSAMHKRYPRSANFAFELPDVQRGHVVACAVGHICHRSILTGGKPCRTSVDRRWVTIRNHVDPCGVTGLSNSAIC